MSALYHRGSVPQSQDTGRVRLGHPATGRARDRWPHLRDRLIPGRIASDEAFDDHLLEDIGLSRADLAALRL